MRKSRWVACSGCNKRTHMGLRYSEMEVVLESLL
jgi:hypothetical protein